MAHRLAAKLVKAGLPDAGELCSWAAMEAARVLRNNWEDALYDGTPIDKLIGDVDEVCAILQAWKTVVLGAMAE